MFLSAVRSSKRLSAGVALCAAMLVLASCSDEKKEEQASPAPASPAAATSDATPAATPATPGAAPATPAAPTASSNASTAAPAASTPAPAPAATAQAPSTPAAAVDVPKPDGEVDIAKLMAPGPLPEMAVGKADAPVTIVEYMSMTCPHCAHFHNTTFDAVKQKYVETGKVRFILREFPFDPRAAAAFMLARCAPEGQYFPMVSMLFRQQTQWAAAENGREALLQMSKLAGFTQESFEKCLTDQKLLDDVNAVMQKGAKEFGVNATPTFFINGKRYSGDMSLETISALVDPLL